MIDCASSRGIGNGGICVSWNSLRDVPDKVFFGASMPPASCRQVGSTAALGVFAMAAGTLLLEEGLARLGGLRGRMLRSQRRRYTQKENWKKRDFHRLWMRTNAPWMDSQFNDGKRSAFYKDYWLSAICVVAPESLPSLGSESFLELKEWNNGGDGI